MEGQSTEVDEQLLQWLYGCVYAQGQVAVGSQVARCHCSGPRVRLGPGGSGGGGPVDWVG